MKKHEIITALTPFTDELDITVTDREGKQVDIKHLDYGLNNGEGVVTIVPMGSHLPKDIHWVRMTQ